MHWHDYFEILIAITVIVDPLGSIPIFMSLTANESERERHHTARVAALVSAIILVIASLLGELILKVFGISIASFRVGGGIIILLMAISMMSARISRTKHTPEEEKEAESKENVAVVPLALPLLAGPAAISTVIIYAHQSPGSLFKGFLISCIILVALFTWASLRLSIPLSRKLGQTGLNNVTRVMGLLLAAIAVEFISTGMLELFPGLR